MLINCVECGLQVSDKALSCPHCGLPFKVGRQVRKQANLKKLPNGFGQISKINGNLRKPYRVMISAGKNEFGRPISKLLKPVSYFKTYNEAYSALLEYHKNPYDIDSIEMTIDDLYQMWIKKYTETSSPSESVLKSFTTCYNYLGSIKNEKVINVKTKKLKQFIENATYYNKPNKKMPEQTKIRVKTMLSMMYDYAIEYEVISHNYARDIVIDRNTYKALKTTKKDHISFTDEEMKILWNNTDKPFVKVILIQCYSGWRPQEMWLLRKEDVNLDNWTFSGGMKTAAGKNRVVPIHTLIRPFVSELYHNAESRGSEYILGGIYEKSVTNYNRFMGCFNKMKEELKLSPEHRPHDARKQFITMAKRFNVDEYAIKRIVGHAITDITEKVYTDRDLNWLSKEIEKIKFPV